MTSITIPDVDEALKARLAARAALRGKSLESEALDILREALGEEERSIRHGDLHAAIRSVIEPLGGIELDIPSREPVREPPQLG